MILYGQAQICASIYLYKIFVMAHEIIDGMEQGYKAFVFEPTHERFLVIQRQVPLNRHRPEAWDIPGGRQKKGEPPIGALRRELREEVPWLRSTVDLADFDLGRSICGRQVIEKSTGGFVLRRLVVAEALEPTIPLELAGRVGWATPAECLQHGTDEYLHDFLSHCLTEGRDLAELLPA
jgi:8-oxo-dGTP pyrophosphatase MutT (NUDIX family)